MEDEVWRMRGVEDEEVWRMRGVEDVRCGGVVHVGGRRTRELRRRGKVREEKEVYTRGTRAVA